MLLTISCAARTYEACDPELALKIAREITPDVAIIDLAMPKMDGFSLRRALQDCPTCANTLFIAMSGYCSARDILASREAGFHLHLAKPAEPQKLCDIVLRPERYRD